MEPANDPTWLPAAIDLLDAAALILTEALHHEHLALAYENLPAPVWGDQAAKIREEARQLERAAAILNWVAGRSDRLHLIAKPRPWAELMRKEGQ
jgi:hypothetical protein